MGYRRTTPVPSLPKGGEPYPCAPLSGIKKCTVFVLAVQQIVTVPLLPSRRGQGWLSVLNDTSSPGPTKLCSKEPELILLRITMIAFQNNDFDPGGG
jgi:hypothetical protein